MSVFSRFAFVFFASIMAMALDAAPLSKYEPVAGRQVIEQAFPDVTRVIPRKGNRAIQELYVRKELVGYAYQSLDFVQTPAYSGKPVTWDAAINSNIDLSPQKYDFAADPPVLPDAEGNYPVPVPGKTVVV